MPLMFPSAFLPLAAPTVRIAARRKPRLPLDPSSGSLIVFGPPGSGKTVAVVVPAVLRWPGPAIVVSTKTDLVRTTVAHRRTLGQTMIFDPFELTGAPTDNWSPLTASATWDGALETGWRLAGAGEIDSRTAGDGEFWAHVAQQRLAPMLWAAANSDNSVEQLIAWAYGQRTDRLTGTLEALCGQHGRHPSPDHQAAIDFHRSYLEQPDRVRAMIDATVQSVLRVYRFTRVARSTHNPSIDAHELLSGSNTLYVVGDGKAARLLHPIFLTLLSELIDGAYAAAHDAGGRLPRPLLICLDDAPTAAPLGNLAEIASTCHTHSIQLITICHELPELEGRYHAAAVTVAHAHRNALIMPGTRDEPTIQPTARSRVRRLVASTGRSHVAAVAPAGRALLRVGRQSPVTVPARAWFKDRRLRRLAGR